MAAILSTLAWFLFPLFHLLWRALDEVIPKRADQWAFCTHFIRTEAFVENPRAVFECVKSDRRIKKIVFYRGRCSKIDLERAENVRVVRHGSLRGLFLLSRCKVVFLSNSVAMDLSMRWNAGQFSVLTIALRRRIVVNLWHGIALKRLFYAANHLTWQHTTRGRYRNVERRGYAGLITSSDIDSYAMAAMFFPLNYRQVWITGLPRNDFLLKPEAELPAYIRDSVERIRSFRRGKKLVIYAPTYRQTSASRSARYYKFCDDEIAALRRILEENDAVLGYRPHYFKNSSEYFNFAEYVDDETIFDFSQNVIPEFSAIARECEVLITDYSSVYMETMYLDKTAICFAYDLEDYRSQQDGLLYDLDLAFPGPICTTFSDMLVSLGECLGIGSESHALKRQMARQMFFKYRDTNNSQRVCQRVFDALEQA